MNTLLTFAQSDIDYIQKHNANYSNIQSAINALEALAASSAAASANPGTFLKALFGTGVALIGSTSYNQSTSGTTMNFTSGFCWRPSLSMVLSRETTSSVNFTGITAATYFIVIDATGTPVRTSNSTEAIYSVVWSGTGFGTITLLAPIVWGAADFIAAQTSAALAATYLTLDARLEAGETKAVAGDLARTYVKGKLNKAVGGGVDVTLTDIEANNFVLRFTGALTANINVKVNLSNSPRGWIVQNDTTGAYTLNFQGTSGSGIKLAQSSRAWVMHDGTNIISAGIEPQRPAVAAFAYAASVTIDFSYCNHAKLTLTGNCNITLTGAAPEQKCILELTQGGAGGYTVTWGSEVAYGDDLTVLTLSTATGKSDKVGFIFNNTTLKYDAIAIMRGFQ